MQPLKEYSVADWLRLIPVDERFRRGRNILLQALHRRRRAPGQAAIVDRLRVACARRPLVATVAFNTPEVIGPWVGRMVRLAPGCVPLVCDNSTDPAARAAIAACCRRAGVAYVPVPRLPLRLSHNGSRSHGMALSWVFHTVVAPVAPPVFAFLDHDLFPVAPVDFAAMVASQPVFGLGSRSFPDPARPWSLWAGFCVFRFELVAGRALDFTPDHRIGLDTGGQNWGRLYRHLDRAGLRLAGKEDVTVCTDRASLVLERIDRFAHLSDAAQRVRRGERFEELEALLERLEAQAGPMTAAEPSAENRHGDSQ